MSILILDNLRSVQNTASIFRTAECSGIREVYLCGTTPAPEDRFGRERKDFVKISLGAETTINWTYFKTTKEAIEKAKGADSTIIALEQDKGAKNYRDIEVNKSFALILGNEVNGIDKEILDLSDEIIEIPIIGQKESLNVTVACGIALFQLLKL